MATPMSHTWEQLTTANDDIDGQLIVGMLEETGIETKLVKDRSGYGDYLFGGSNPHAPVAVHVHADDLERARRLLATAGDVSDPETATEMAGGGGARRYPWATLIAVGIVALIVLSFLLQQRELIF